MLHRFFTSVIKNSIMMYEKNGMKIRIVNIFMDKINNEIQVT